MSTVTEIVSLEQLIETVVLPALPQTALALMQLEQDAEAGPNDFARVLESDPGLTGQVLKFANSSYFGFSRTITSLPQTLMLVGVRTVTSFSLWNAVFTLIPNPSVGNFNLRQLWQDSLRRAVAARIFGKTLRVANPEELFVGALLQDMAIPVLLKEVPHIYRELLEQRAAQGVRLSQLEDAQLGWNHGTAAALLAKRWQLPGRLMDLVRTHTDLRGGLVLGPRGYDQACVALAACLPSTSDSQWHDQHEFTAGMQYLFDKQGVDLQQMIDRIDRETNEFAPLLQLPAPAKSIRDWLNQSS